MVSAGFAVTTILVDSREKQPLRFENYLTEVATLPVADYGIAGFSNWTNPGFVVERKSLGDLIGSLTSGRPRFWREVEKMRQFRFAAIVIEATHAEVEAGHFRSKATPQSILASLYAIQVRAGIHVLWCGDAQGAARTIESLVRQFCRGIEKDAKRLRTSTLIPAPCAPGPEIAAPAMV